LAHRQNIPDFLQCSSPQKSSLLGWLALSDSFFCVKHSYLHFAEEHPTRGEYNSVKVRFDNKNLIGTFGKDKNMLIFAW